MDHHLRYSSPQTFSELMDTVIFVTVCVLFHFVAWVTSKTVPSLELHPVCKLISWSVTVSWILAENLRLLGQRQRTLLQGSEVHGVPGSNTLLAPRS